jgi:flagellar protein FliS
LTYQKKQAHLDSYRSTDVSTAGRLKLLIMLYEGALRFAARADEAISTGDMAAKGAMIGKVIAIVDELNNTLDHGQAPEIAANLARLYEFTRDRLLRANVRNDAQPLREAANVLKTLHSAWVEVSKKPMSELTAAAEPDKTRALKTAQGPHADSYLRISV